MKKKFAFLVAFFVMISVVHAFSQSCYCPGSPRQNLYSLSFSKDTLKLCGFEYDKYNNDKIIGSFVLSQCSVDTLLINTFHDEGSAYLFQKTKDGFTIAQLDLTKENGIFQYPKQFESISVSIINNKPGLKKVYVSAEPIVKYLEKNFKKLSELYK